MFSPPRVLWFFKVYVFLKSVLQKLPPLCPKQVKGDGGRVVKATFGQCPKVSSFFLDGFP